jgi:hypothetical protein
MEQSGGGDAMGARIAHDVRSDGRGWRRDHLFDVVPGGSRTNFQGNGQQQGWTADPGGDASVYARDQEIDSAAVGYLFHAQRACCWSTST